MFFFFFSSRRRHTRLQGDWSSDVCSSDLIALFAWADIRMPIVKVDPAARVATLTLDPRPSNQEADARYFVENAPDALDMAGEWYLDRKTHTVTYWPVAGENMPAEQVIAPALVQLVRLEGRPEAGEFVRNVTFRGLQFAHADWSMDPKGYADTQAATPAPAAVEATGAVECKLERCTVADSGGYAIAFGRGSKRNQVQACELFDSGGGGHQLGEGGPSPDHKFEKYANGN